MSRYKTITTKITDIEMVKKALTDLGLPYAIDTNVQYDRTRQQASVVIRSQHIGTRYDDIGFFAEHDGTYRITYSDHDSQDKAKAEQWVQRIVQTYGKHKAIALAKARGLTVVSEQNDNGIIRLKLRGYKA